MIGLALSWLLRDPIRAVALVGCALFFGTSVWHAHQRDAARADVRSLTAERDAAQAIAAHETARAVAAEKTAQAAAAAARQDREQANADVASWQRVAADRYRSLRLCYATPAGGGAVPEAGDGGEAGAAGGAVPDGVGPRLVELAARADRLRNALAECYAVDDANRALR